MRLRGGKYIERRREILGGPIIKTLLSIGWPTAVSDIFQTIYNLADIFWVAKLGTERVGATTLAFPVVFLFMMISMGLAVAGVSYQSFPLGNPQALPGGGERLFPFP
ncbi:MAG: MATE family efflux transporter, partial [Chloroflexota bacterium]|nr:MATE family efflux transporter [Chloroflexota bacterium]